VIPPKNFGDGWLTKSAQDLCKIAIVFGGFDAAEVVLAIAKVQDKRSVRASVPTVEKALQIVYEAHQTPEQKAARVAAYTALKARLHGA